MVGSRSNPKHRFISFGFLLLTNALFLTTLEGCISSKMDSPRITLLRVGGLIDGGDSPVKTPTWVKIVNGVITEIIPDIPENKGLETEASSPSTLYIDAR